MEIIKVFAAAFFVVSILANGCLFFYIRRVYKKDQTPLNAEISILKKELKAAKEAPTYDATCLLQDLMSGPGLVKIEYVDKSDLFLRSPRHDR